MTPDFILFIPTMSPPDENCVAETEYGVSIAAVIGRDNLWATQFHPEKSGAHGIQILKNFVAN